MKKESRQIKVARRGLVEKYGKNFDYLPEPTFFEKLYHKISGKYPKSYYTRKRG